MAILPAGRQSRRGNGLKRNILAIWGRLYIICGLRDNHYATCAIKVGAGAWVIFVKNL